MKASDGTSKRPPRAPSPAAGARERRASAASSSSTARNFRLSGPSARLDPRLDAFRDDLADIALSEKVLAPHYARALIQGCGIRAALISDAPGDGARPMSELLPGEDFAVLEYTGGWAWGYALQGKLVGYVEAIALSDRTDATHIVCESAAPVTADARMTAPILANLPMGARLRGEECGACLTTEYGCVSLSHLRRIGQPEDDAVGVAERLFGVPWLAGGRTAHGINAAGLVQLALTLCGVDAPRLAEHYAALGAPATGTPRRGDVACFRGAVGLMVDDRMLIHASEAAGRVTVSPLAALPAEQAFLRRL